MKTLTMMFVLGLALGIAVGFFFGSAFPKVYRTQETEVTGVYFSPNGGCEDAVLTWINKANSSIHVLIYSFTLESIADALIGARHKGVDVKVVFEKSQISQYSEYPRLHNVGIDVRNDTNPNLMHNKVMIVDGSVILTGSFNWSNNAQDYNNENLVVIHSESVAGSFESDFQAIWNESV